MARNRVLEDAVERSSVHRRSIVSASKMKTAGKDQRDQTMGDKNNVDCVCSVVDMGTNN